MTSKDHYKCQKSNSTTTIVSLAFNFGTCSAFYEVFSITIADLGSLLPQTVSQTGKINPNLGGLKCSLLCF